jgi:hypothetical protein
VFIHQFSETINSIFNFHEKNPIYFVDLLWNESIICATKSSITCLPGAFADPHVAVFNGKYYIYPTTDGFEGWSSDYFTVWSSKDMKKWKKEGTILDFKKTLLGHKNVLGHPQLLSKTINTTSIFRQIPTLV